MTELQVRLPCECGNKVTVRAADAGGAVLCKCGRSVAVPRLSQLRVLAGADAYVTNPVGAIRKSQQEKSDLTEPRKCVLCGAIKPNLYQCTAICEQSHVKRGDDGTSSIWHWLLLPLVVNILMSFHRKPAYAESRGHDVDVTFILPVCDECELSNGKATRPSVAKKIMNEVPLYRELLAFYPNLTLRIERTPS
jgi:hypothetical protein